MGLFKDCISKTRRPEGFLGKLMLCGMNGGHAKLADWGMENLPPLSPERAAGLGCGGGRNIAALVVIMIVTQRKEGQSVCGKEQGKLLQMAMPEEGGV